MPPSVKPISQFYHDLRALDPGIADRWRFATNDDPNRKLDFETMVKIVGWSRKKEFNKKGQKVNRLVQGDEFNGNQAKAIVLLLDKMTNEKDAKDIFVTTLRKLDEEGRLLARKWVFSPDGAKRITDLIFSCAHALSWHSPGSRFSYTPLQYSAVGELIKTHEIDVVEYSSGGLDRVLPIAAQYDAEVNLLKIDLSRSDAEKRYFLFRELTHAVQDWYDLKVIKLFVESDAYIGGAVAARTSGQRLFKGRPLYDAAFAAAEFVFSKDTSPSNVNWIYAYGAVVTEVKKSHPDAQTMPSNGEVLKNGGKSEQQRIEDVINSIKAEAAERQRQQLEKPLGPYDRSIPIR
ncbi:hypothetical protein [Bradyrhizobium prioriisuperbiae]|uniref:hypothetical protein n=1 Tax=Bradyrhizobium prioriisuperbiae TaxID=2854389 RepID=UPI0028EC8A06|nr:hypothetical protein [Bradyrhizobium prioritasuperba]